MAWGAPGLLEFWPCFLSHDPAHKVPNQAKDEANDMAKPELGIKRVCVACGTRFYDLCKTPAVCPKCNTEQPAEQQRGRRVAGNVPEDKRPKKVIPGVEEADVEIEAVDVDDEDVLEDTSDLEDDDDAIAGDIEITPPSPDDI